MLGQEKERTSENSYFFVMSDSLSIYEFVFKYDKNPKLLWFSLHYILIATFLNAEI